MPEATTGVMGPGGVVTGMAATGRCDLAGYKMEICITDSGYWITTAWEATRTFA